MTTLIAKIDFPKQDKLTRHFGLVLVQKDEKYGPEYVTWIKYLDGAREHASGNYFTSLAEAYRDFHTRCERYIAYIERKETLEQMEGTEI